MKRKAVSGIVLMLLLTSMLSSAFIIQQVKAEVAESPWPMFQHDAQHTGRSPFVGPKSEQPEIRVLVEGERDSDYFFPSVIGSDGTLYLGARITEGGVTKEGLFAFNPDGTEKWFYEISNPRGTPALFETENTVYILSYSEFGGISAIDTQTGNLRWSKSFAVLYGDQSPVLDEHGILYFIAGLILPDDSYDSGLVAVNKSGEAIWVYAIEKGETYFDFQLPDEGGPGFASRGPASVVTIGIDGTIYFGYGDTLYALDADGTKKWQRTFEGERPNIPFAPVVSSSGVLYVLVNGIYYQNYAWHCRLYVLSTDGNILWERTLAESFDSPPAIDPDGTIYLSIFWYAGRYQVYPIWYLVAVDTQGQLKWQVWPSIRGLSNLIVDAEGNVFASGRSSVAGYNSDGILLWSFTVKGGLLALNHDGTLLVPGFPGKKLYAIRDLSTAPPNQPPTCLIKLQKDGVEISEVDVWEFFDIYVGDSTDDTGIKQVRFSSDDAQDGVPTGEWTDWYNWTTSSGDWDASTKIKRWAFATPGKKEVWAEVKDDINQTSVSSRDIRATVNGKSTEFSVGDYIIIQKYSLLYKEPRLDSESYYIYEDKCGRIIENENNGIFADGHFWWYVEVGLFEYWVWEEAIIKNQPPIPSLNYAPKHPKANEEVVFDASESQDTDGKIIRYTWYLDGKFIGWTENPIMFYVFEKEGTFSLKVEVTDDCLESASIEVTIEVEGRTRPEKIKRILGKDDIIKIADDLGIPHYTQDYGWWSQIEYFVLNGKTYSEDELLGLLNRPIKKISETGELVFVEDVIYGMRIRNILEDAKLVDLTSRSTWISEKDDFKNLGKTNSWAETIVKLAEWEEPLLKQLLKNVAFSLELPLLHVVGALIGPMLTIAEGYRVYKTLGFLEDILYKRALWFYLKERIGGVDSVTAFGSSPVPIEYVMEGRGETTRRLWEELYLAYEPYIIPGEGGLGENLEIIKAELRKHIYDTMESYSLMPRKFVRIGSVGELRIYDSEGRVTGIVNGEIREEIPYSMYDEETETIIIFPAISFYHYEILGIDQGTYSLKITSVEYGNTTTFTTIEIPVATNAIHQYTVDWDALSLGEEGVTVMVDSDSDGVFEHTFTSDSELTQSEYVIATDKIPPETWLSIDEPKFVVDDLTYLTSATPITLMAEDNAGGSGVASTAYRIYNAAYDSGWTTYTQPFYLTGLSDGTYPIDFNSTDIAGNIEPTNTVTVILDNTGPSVEVVNPPAGWALQDGVTFIISAIDAGSGVSYVNFSIREADGGEGAPVGFEDLQATYDATTGKWTLFFDTLQLPDGYYVVLVKAKDNLGNIASTTVPYSIRNWAVIELLPASENNKAGRTMPVKFALRVAASVDPNQPFVYNEELTIKIYDTNDPSNILQTSTFGDTARDYRINSTNELYITNFKTLKTPTQYTVSVCRGMFLIDSFNFSTVK